MPRSDTAELVKELKELSGLSVQQIARAFGVANRSVHNWMRGRRMSPPNEERLAELLAEVRGLPSDTPEGRRATAASRKARTKHLQLLGAERTPRSCSKGEDLEPEGFVRAAT